MCFFRSQVNCGTEACVMYLLLGFIFGLITVIQLQIFFITLRQHKTRIQKQSEQSVARPTLGQITAAHQPLAARTPSQGAITSNLHRRGPRWTGLPFLISFPPPASERSALTAPGFCASVKWSAMINCAENFPEGSKWSCVAPICLLNF